MTTDPACIFCRIAEGRAPSHVVWSDAEHVAFLDINPITAGHLVVIPREHVPWVDELPADAHARLFARVRELAGPVAVAAGAPHAGIAVEGYGVPHAHVHLVPVWRGGELDPCRQVRATEDALQQAAARLRSAIDAAAPALPGSRGTILPTIRKQYFFRPSARGLMAWDVGRLIQLSRELPRQRVALGAIREIDQPWFGDDEPITWRSMVEHVKLMDAAQLSFPIILAADGTVMDGMHRVAKALRAGLSEIEAVRFTVDPPPDHVGLGPDGLPY